MSAPSVSIYTDEPVYLLLGSTELIERYQQEGVMALEDAGMTEYDLSVLNDGDDFFNRLLVIKEFGDYLVLTEDEYNKIENL